jgi:hypothetical protein
MSGTAVAAVDSGGHPLSVDDEMGICRAEVIEIFEALADVKAGVNRILRYIEEADGEEEEEEDLGQP